MDKEQKKAIIEQVKFLRAGMLPPDLLEFLRSSPSGRELIQWLIKKSLLEKLLYGELSPEDQLMIDAKFDELIKGIELEKITHDRSDIETREGIDTIFNNERGVDSRTRREKIKTFPENLVDAWIKNQKNLPPEKEIEVKEKVLKKYSEETQRGVFLSPQQIERELSLSLSKGYIPSPPSREIKEAEKIYAESVANTRTLGMVLADLAEDVPASTPVLLRAEATKREIIQNPEITDSRIIRERSEAVARATIATASEYAGSAAPLVLWNKPAFRTVENGINDLILNKDLENEMKKYFNVDALPVFEVLLEYAQHSQQATPKDGLSSAVTSLSNVVNEVVGSVASGAPEIKRGYGTFMMIKGMTLLKGKYSSPWMSFLAESVSAPEVKAQEALFGVWMLTASKENVDDLTKRILENNNEGGFFEQIKSLSERSEFFKLLLEKPEDTLAGFKKNRSLKTVFSMYFSQLFSVQGESRFTRLTGLEFFGSAFRIAIGRPKKADLAYYKQIGSDAGKNFLSKAIRVAIDTRGRFSLGRFALGLINSFGGGVRGAVVKAAASALFANPWVWVALVVLVLVLFVLIGPLAASPQQIANNQLAASLSGGGVGPSPGGSTIACQVGTGECRWPTRGCITQGPSGSFSHAGTQAIDISASLGTPVGAAYDGVVNIVNTGFGPQERTSYRSFGNAVYIQHTAVINGQTRSFTSIYAHLATVTVRRLQVVEQGDQIGTVGSSGYSTGPHLHYQTSIPINSVLPSVVPQCNNIGDCTRAMGASRCF